MPFSFFSRLGVLRLNQPSTPPNPGHLIPPPPAAELLVSRNLNTDIARLRQEIADLERRPHSGHLLGNVWRSTLAQKKARLNELLGLGQGGIPPAPASAPTFGSITPTDRTGVEDLKIIPPR